MVLSGESPRRLRGRFGAAACQEWGHRDCLTAPGVSAPGEVLAWRGHHLPHTRAAGGDGAESSRPAGAGLLPSIPWGAGPGSLRGQPSTGTRCNQGCPRWGQKCCWVHLGKQRGIHTRSPHVPSGLSAQSWGRRRGLGGGCCCAAVAEGFCRGPPRSPSGRQGSIASPPRRVPTPGVPRGPVPG